MGAPPGIAQANLPLTLVFPMAGQGARFGYRFKPFLVFKDQLFIEAAVRPFLSHRGQIDRIVFAYLAEQEAAFNVSQRLAQVVPETDFVPAILPAPTRGPTETLAGAVEAVHLRGPVMVCDCDHSLDVGRLFRALAEGEQIDCLIPTWDLKGEDPASWSVAAVEPDGSVSAIAEKSIPPSSARHAGVIGCYYFRDVEEVVRLTIENQFVYFSDIIRHFIANGKRVKAVPISQAIFFGDPARLERSLQHPEDQVQP